MGSLLPPLLPLEEEYLTSIMQLLLMILIILWLLPQMGLRLVSELSGQERTEGLV